MEDYVKGNLAKIVNDKLPDDKIDELKNFFSQTLSLNLEKDDEKFFKSLAYEMKGELKDFALLIVDFKKDLRAKIRPEITDIATKYIPQTTDQLEGIIETTEAAANKIMDNLENMQGQTEKIGEIIAYLKKGEIKLPEDKGVRLDLQTVEAIHPLINYMESDAQNTMSLISDSFVQMSFQDLTGQRIKRIMTLVQQMEEKLKGMIIAFGIKLSEHEKNPDMTEEELQKAVEEKVIELAGPQKSGYGLDQGDIDDLLASF
ncbi:MAG: protein phosphatase CheZ [Ignavibacteriaceae bacterium]|jgi:chemotaxis protein CheZ|nr:protein phosphatase CheZ [Ignavibacteriaceae bacterium]